MRSMTMAATMAFGALAFAAMAANGQGTGMTRAQAQALYGAGGFPISADGRNPTNRCGTPANPRITLVDMNADGRKEALFIDTGPCYRADGRWYAIATQAPDGSWRRILEGPGNVQVAGTMANGWFVLNTSSAAGAQTLVYNGQSYAPRGSAAPSGAAKPAPPPSAPRLSAPPPSAPPTGTRALAPSASGTAKPGAAAAPAPTMAAQAPAARDAAIFRAAGFKQIRGNWDSGCNDPSAGSYYEPGKIEQMKDLNGDGRPEAIVTEGGTYCYGITGTAFWLVGQQANGSWKLLYNAVGIPEILATKGVGGWPDISVGGPGFCFPVMRWNGTAYVQNRFAYEGKPCRR